MGGGSRVEDSVGRNRFSCTMLSTFRSLSGYEGPEIPDHVTS